MSPRLLRIDAHPLDAMVFRADSVRFEACATFRGTPFPADGDVELCECGWLEAEHSRRWSAAVSSPAVDPDAARAAGRGCRDGLAARTASARPTCGCASPRPLPSCATVFFFAGAFLAAAFFAARLRRGALRRDRGARLLGAGAGEARLERGHEVEHLGRLLGRGRGDDLLARGLPLDEREHLLAVLVVVLLGVERRPRACRRAGAPSSSSRSLGSAASRPARGRPRAPRRRSAWSRGTACRRSDGSRRAPPSSAARTDRPRPCLVLHHRRQEPVGLGRVLVGHQVVGLLEVHGVDLGRGRRSPRSRSCGWPSAAARRARRCRARRSGRSRARSP